VKHLLTAVVIALVVAACAVAASSLPSPSLSSGHAISTPVAASAVAASPLPSPSLSSGHAISTPEAASAAATRLASIGGPLTVGEIKHGMYADLWGGSTNDVSGQGTADRTTKAGLMVWRVDVTGPRGQEEVYLDDATGLLIDSITQGN
jgi:hypothetical protein